MPTSVTGTSTERRRRSARSGGFSLLELLVVVVIIGLFAGAAVLSMGVLGNDRDIEREAFRLRSLMNLLREEALMQSRDFGILFTDNSYRFYAYDYQQLRWVVPVGEGLFVEHELDEPLNIDLRVEDRDLVLDAGFQAARDDDEDEEDDDPEPQVMVLSSGEMTPFEADIFRDLGGGRFTLAAELDGTIEVTQDGFSR